jgi:hypothetical protein
MSLGINGPDNNIPAIQKSHHTNDGGAGNLGYFQQERKKKEEKDDENDVFELSSNKEDENKEEEIDELGSLTLKIKNFWKSLKEPSQDKKNPEE